MEARRRLLGIGCVGLCIVTVMAAAGWNSEPSRLLAAQGDGLGSGVSIASDEPAIAPSPPPVRPDIRSGRYATPMPAAAQPQSAQPDEAAPMPPPVRPDILSSREREVPVASPDVAPLAPQPISGAAEATTDDGTRSPAETGGSNTDHLGSEPAKPLYPATGQPSVSPTAILRASDAQPGGRETMLDGNLLLVEAHELAEVADSPPQYTKIVELCHAGIQAGVSAEAVQFAHALIAWAYNRRGEAYDELGEANKALVDFNAAVKHEPTKWQAVHNRGVSLAQAGRVREALEDFTRTIQLQPRYGKAYSNRATINEQQGKARDALMDFQKAAELSPALAAAHAGIGRCQLQLNRPQEALIALDEAVRIDQENPAFLTSRGDVYAALGDYEAALTDYGKAIEVDPTYATAYRNGSWLLATCPDERFRDEENAVVGAQKALGLAFGDRHLCLDTLAAAHANAGEFDRAVEVMQQAIQEAPQPVQSFYSSRLKLYQEGQPFRAQPLTQQAAYEETAP